MNKIYRDIVGSSFIIFLILVSSATAVGQAVDFNPSPNSEVVAIATQADGKILIGGNFIAIGGVNRRGLARLDENGELDESFDADLNERVSSIAVQDDGKILIGGRFTTIGGFNGFIRNRIARLNSDGSVDTSFNPDANSVVSGVFVQPDGKILISSASSIIGGVLVDRFVRLNSDGTVDPSFAVVDSSFRPSVVRQLSDGKLLVNGLLTVNGVTRRVTRLNSDGSIDASFEDPNVSFEVFDLVVQDDGKIIIAGSISSVGDRVRSNIARLNNDGSLDVAFNPIVNLFISALGLQEDGKIILGGVFDEIDSIARNAIARLNIDGSVDESFDPGIRNASEFSKSFVSELVIQEDGRILVGGSFPRVGSFSRNNFVRLNSDGSVDGVASSQCFPITALNGAVPVICL